MDGYPKIEDSENFEAFFSQYDFYNPTEGIKDGNVTLILSKREKGLALAFSRYAAYKANFILIGMLRESPRLKYVGGKLEINEELIKPDDEFEAVILKLKEKE